MKYKTILLDPPWNEKGGGKYKRGADKHYQVMTKEDILRVIVDESPWDPNPEECSIWMWSTVSSLEQALWLMKKLGATYVTHAVWVKSKALGAHIIPDHPGLGQRMRICHELLLYGRIGRVPVPPPYRRFPSTIYAQRRKHSQKPEEAYERIIAHDGEVGSKLELFGREKREGWVVWGNEISIAEKDGE